MYNLRTRIGTLSLSVLIFGFLSILLGMDKNYDLRNYHFYAPYAFLNNRYSFDVSPGQQQGYFNPSLDLIFYNLIIHINQFPRLIAFIMGAIQGINIFILYFISRIIIPRSNDHHSTLENIIAVLIGGTGAGIISLVGTTTNDLFISIFILASLLFGLKAISQTTATANPHILPILSGLALGLGIGFKYTAVIFAPGIAILIIYSIINTKRWLIIVSSGVSVLSGFFLSAGFHMVVLWRLFRNPMFPELNGLFLSPFYETVSLRDENHLPHTVLKLIAFPFYWARTNNGPVTEVAFRDPRAATAYVLVALLGIGWVLSKRRRWMGGDWDQAQKAFTMVIAFAAVSYFLWAIGFAIYRYAIVLEMLTGPIIVGSLILLVRRRSLAVTLAALTLLALIASTQYFDWGRRPFGSAYMDVHVPAIPDNSEVFIIGTSPVSYLIPFMNPTARFLATENSLLSIDGRNRLSEAFRNALRTPQPNRFILITDGRGMDREKIDAILAKFDLHTDDAGCLPIEQNMSEVTRLCPVR